MKLPSIVPKNKPFSFGTIKMGYDPFYYNAFLPPFCRETLSSSATAVDSQLTNC